MHHIKLSSTVFSILSLFLLSLFCLWILDNTISKNELTIAALTAVFTGTMLQMTLFHYTKKEKSISKIKHDPTESKIYDGPARFFKGPESIGGKLLLTDKRLIFRSHSMQFHNNGAVVVLDEILDIMPKKTGKIVHNGLSIVTDNREYQFELENRDNWIRQISDRMAYQTA